MSDDAIHEAYARAAGRWTGCDWPTRFGEAELDLNGMRSDKALLMARATAGAESARWRDAARWLARVEQDARTAGEAARAAVALVGAGDLAAALEQARFACTLEAGYPHPPVWQPLRLAIEATLSDGPTPKSLTR